MNSPATELAHRLARDAEAVCRHYLSNGRREGRYWLVGDVDNSPGRSLFVRLTGPDSGKGAAGKWTDAATGEHGDLLDLIAANRRLDALRDVLEEAHSFLRLPRLELTTREQQTPAPRSSPEAARRLWAAGKPVRGTLAELYLRSRAITAPLGCPPLRFHPRCYTKEHDEAEPQTWPALLAAVTDLDGSITGLHRTWLDSATGGKAPLSSPRRAMGNLLGHGVRFGLGAGRETEVLAAGEGLETVLALRTILPRLAAVAALSANHLAAIELPASLQRLYVVRDDDPAGRRAAETLTTRALADGFDVVVLAPMLNDLDEDLLVRGAERTREQVLRQLAPEDRDRFASA
jgi:hypothetical protein